MHVKQTHFRHFSFTQIVTRTLLGVIAIVLHCQVSVTVPSINLQCIFVAVCIIFNICEDKNSWPRP